MGCFFFLLKRGSPARPVGADFARFRSPDVSRQVGWPSVSFTSRLADRSHLVGQWPLSISYCPGSREILPAHGPAIPLYAAVKMRVPSYHSRRLSQHVCGADPGYDTCFDDSRNPYGPNYFSPGQARLRRGKCPACSLPGLNPLERSNSVPHRQTYFLRCFVLVQS